MPATTAAVDTIIPRMIPGITTTITTTTKRLTIGPMLVLSEQTTAFSKPADTIAGVKVFRYGNIDVPAVLFMFDRC